MKLRELKNRQEADINAEILDENLVLETDHWGYYSSVPLNGIIAIGWLSNDDIFIKNGDGSFIYEVTKKEITFQDFNDLKSFEINISKDNLTFFVQCRSETIFIFGIRGGGGNLLTKDQNWYLGITNISWNIKVPMLENYKIGKRNFIKLTQNYYEGYLYLGFSISEKYFVVMGDGGLDIFYRKGQQ
jgi:hypothetical protein